VIQNNGRPPIVVLGINTARGKTEKHRLQAAAASRRLNKNLLTGVLAIRPSSGRHHRLNQRARCSLRDEHSLTGAARVA